MATSPRGLSVRQRLPVSARSRPAELPPNLQKYVNTGDALIAEPSRRITADGNVIPQLFPIEKTGISARPVQDAAEAFRAALGREQRTRALFALDSDAWRRWSNIHPFLMRHDVSLEELSPAQRDGALALLRESLRSRHHIHTVVRTPNGAAGSCARSDQRAHPAVTEALCGSSSRCTHRATRWRGSSRSDASCSP